MIITSKIEMDLMKGGEVPQIRAVQNDRYSRNLEISLLSGGVPWPVPEGVSVLVHYVKPDGTGGSYDALPNGESAVAAAQNTLTVALAPQVCTVSGFVQMAVTLLKGQTELNTLPILLNILPMPGAGMKSDSYFRLNGVLPLGGWEPNLYLGTDAGGNVAAISAPDGSGLGGNVEIDASLTTAGAAADAKAVGDALGKKLDISGGTLTGNLNISGSIMIPTDGSAGIRDNTDNPVLRFETIDNEYSLRVGHKGARVHLYSSERPKYNGNEIALKKEIPDVSGITAYPGDEHINSLINTALGVIENGAY